MKELKRKTLNALVWDLGGKFSIYFIGLIISIFLARLLPPRDFGVMAIISVFISLSGIFISSGLDLALIQRKDLSDYHYGSVFIFNISIGAILALLTFTSAGFIADFYKNQELKQLMRVASLSFLIYSFGQVKTTWLSKNLRFDIINKANFTSNLSGGILAIILAYKGYGVWALVIQSITIGIVYNIYIHFSNKWRLPHKFSLDALKDLWGFGFKMFLSTGVNTISAQIDSLFIGKIFNMNLLGYYYRAKSLNFYFINFSSSSISSVFFPVLSSIKEDTIQFKTIFFKTFHIVSFISILLFSILFLSAEDIIIILFSSKWLPSVIYLKILLAGAFAYPISSLLMLVLTSNGNSSAFLRLEIAKQIMVFSTLIFGIYFGIINYMIFFLIAIYLSVILNSYYSAKELGIPTWNILKVILSYYSLGIMSMIIPFILKIFLTNINVFLRICTTSLSFVIFYFILSILFKTEAFSIIKKETNIFIDKYR